MAFTIIREDLARVDADAIIVPAGPNLLPDGGAAYQVAKAAGYRRVRRACKRLGGCAVGQAAATPAFDLPASHIIHAVGPVWQGGSADEARLLRSAYDSALTLALRLNANTVAMPLLSTGTFGYPMREAFEIAVDAIKDFLAANDLDVLLVIYDKRAVTEGSRLFGRVAEYIDDEYVDEHAWYYAEYERRAERYDASFEQAAAPRMAEPAADQEFFGTGSMPALSQAAGSAYEAVEEEAGERPSYFGHMPASQAFCPVCGSPVGEDAAFCMACGYSLRDASRAPSTGAPQASYAAEPLQAPMPAAASQPAPLAGAGAKIHPRWPSPAKPAQVAPPTKPAAPPDLGTLLAHMDDSFSMMLMQLIDARGLTDAQVYKRANISRQHFSKMRNPGYKPTKKTVVALAVALELSLDETRELLARAGFALSHSNKFDIIVEYFITQGSYDIFAINETLFAYDQPLLA
ncbi:MAG: macro domain-containing protein [Coriobacteriia bacterium]|nr:macro domain-containing protein [Coriobacteriia bacterium]